MFGETADLIAVLGLKDQFSGPLKKAKSSLSQFDAKLDSTQGRAFKAGQQIGTGILNGVKIATAGLGALTGLLVLSAHEGQNAQNVQIKFDTAVQNSGKVAQEYTKILDAQTTALSNMTGADDEMIKSIQTMLITQGLTGSQVEKITPLVLAAATQTGRDAETVALAVGRAVQGSATSLGKLGIIVPKAGAATKSAALAALELQKKQLLANQAAEKAAGPLSKAQKASEAHAKAVLDAAIAQQKLTDAQTKGTKAADGFSTVYGVLNQKFKGANEALSGQFDTRLKVLNERLQDLREAAGIKLLPALTRLVDIVAAKLIPAFGQLLDSILPTAIDGLNKLGDFLESGQATSAITKMLDLAKSAAPVIKQAAEDTLFIVKTAVDLFASLPPELQGLAVAGLTINKLTGGLVTNIAGGLISAVISSFKGLMNVNAAVVNVNGGVVNGGGGLPGVAAPAAGVGVGTLPALGLIAASVGATVIGSAAVRSAVDRAIATADVASLTAQAEAARKHGVSDENNAALKALQAIVHNTASLATLPPNPAQDAAEAATQRRNAAFTSNPTRQQLRANIRGATDPKEQARLQGILNARIDRGYRDAKTEAGRILRSSDTSKERLARIVQIQAALKASGDTHTANRLAAKLEELKQAIQTQNVVGQIGVTVKSIIDSRTVNSALTKNISVTGGIDLARGITG